MQQIPSYWRAAITKAWDTFSVHQGIAGVVLPLVFAVSGWVIGSSTKEIGEWTGAAGGLIVAVAWYVFVLLFLTPRQLWNEIRAQLMPVFSVSYDNSLIRPPDHETYRLRIANTGVPSVTGVEVRLESVPTAPYLDGVLPISLRGQHSENPPFALNKDAPLFVDLLQVGADSYSQRTTKEGTLFAGICNSEGSPEYALLFDPGDSHEVEILVEGQNAPTVIKKFRMRCLLPQRGVDLASLDIAEIGDFSPIANTPEPKLLLRYVSDIEEDGETDQEYQYYGFQVRNVGKSVATDVTVLPLGLMGKTITKSSTIGSLSPCEPPALVYMSDALGKTLTRAYILRKDRGQTGAMYLKLRVQYTWKGQPPNCPPAEYVLKYHRGITVTRHVPDELVEWTDFDGLVRQTE